MQIQHSEYFWVYFSMFYLLPTRYIQTYIQTYAYINIHIIIVLSNIFPTPSKTDLSSD